mgnify:CR=1 FL=1
MILKNFRASLALLSAGILAGCSTARDLQAVGREIESQERTKIILEELIEQMEHLERQKDQKDNAYQNTYSNKDDLYYSVSSVQPLVQDNLALAMKQDRNGSAYGMIHGVNSLKGLQGLQRLRESNANNALGLSSSSRGYHGVGSTSSIQNNTLSTLALNNIQAQGVIDTTINSLDDPKRDFDEGDAKRLALTLLTGRDIGAVVE